MDFFYIKKGNFIILLNINSSKPCSCFYTLTRFVAFPTKNDLQACKTLISYILYLMLSTEAFSPAI